MTDDIDNENNEDDNDGYDACVDAAAVAAPCWKW